MSLSLVSPSSSFTLIPSTEEKENVKTLEEVHTEYSSQIVPRSVISSLERSQNRRRSGSSTTLSSSTITCVKWRNRCHVRRSVKGMYKCKGMLLVLWYKDGLFGVDNKCRVSVRGFTSQSFRVLSISKDYL